MSIRTMVGAAAPVIVGVGAAGLGLASARAQIDRDAHQPGGGMTFLAGCAAIGVMTAGAAGLQVRGVAENTISRVLAGAGFGAIGLGWAGAEALEHQHTDNPSTGVTA